MRENSLGRDSRCAVVYVYLCGGIPTRMTFASRPANYALKRTGRVREDLGPEVGLNIGPILAFFSASSCLASATFAAIGSSLYSGNLLSVSSCLCDLAGAM
jgi:hypothetical protein